MQIKDYLFTYYFTKGISKNNNIIDKITYYEIEISSKMFKTTKVKSDKNYKSMFTTYYEQQKF